MKDVKVSVIIPTGANEKLENINRTVESVISNAHSEVEILILADGWVPEGVYKRAKVSLSDTNLGERKTVNRGFKEARGDYVLRIDSHCSMSKGWDKILLNQYKEDTISLCIIDAIDELTWGSLKHNYSFVYVNPSCEEKWWGEYEQNKKLFTEPLTSLKELLTKPIVSLKELFMRPSMSLTGCGWFCSKKFFLDKLQFDEDLSKWGCIGPEMTAKIERAGSSIILNKNVRCGHLFNTAAGGYSSSEVLRTRLEILSRYSKYLYKAAKKFNAPGWENITEDYILNYDKNFVYETDITRKEKSKTLDEDGNIVKKVTKIFEPVFYKGSENPDVPEVGLKITKDSKLQKIEIATLVNEDYKYETIEGKKEVERWILEND